MLRYIAHLSVLASSERFKDFVLPYKGLDRWRAQAQRKSEPRVPYDFCFFWFLSSRFGMMTAFLLLALGMDAWIAISRPGAWESVFPAYFPTLWLFRVMRRKYLAIYLCNLYLYYH